MSTFEKWMGLMGFSGKQFSAAGEAIGIKSYNTVRTRLVDRDEPSKTELLAMSALRAGLPPWSEANDHEAVLAGKLLQTVRELGVEDKAA